MKLFLSKIQSEIGPNIPKIKKKTKPQVDEFDYSTVPLQYNGQAVTNHKELKDLIKID
jgi:ABC-type thiamine transport system substrate-binding protein